MKASLAWQDLKLPEGRLPEGELVQGQRMRIVAGKDWQNAFLQHIVRPQGDWRFCLKTAEATYQAGSEEFFSSVHILLSECGFLANLTIRENLLLPLLYRGGKKELVQASKAVDAVAVEFHLGDLDAHPEDFSPQTHHRIAVARAALVKPNFLIAQELHLGVHLAAWKLLCMSLNNILNRQGSAMLYLTESEDPIPGLRFDRTLFVEAAGW